MHRQWPQFKWQNMVKYLYRYMRERERETHRYLPVINYVSNHRSLTEMYIHDPSSRCASTTVNGRTVSFACHCLFDTCHPYFLQSIVDSRSAGARVRISPVARIYRARRSYIMGWTTSTLSWDLNLRPREQSISREPAARRRTSAHYSRRIDRACERSWLPSLRVRHFYTF